MIVSTAKYRQKNRCLGHVFFPPTCACFSWTLPGAAFSSLLFSSGWKKIHLSKECWFSSTSFPDTFVEFLLLSNGETGMRDIAQSMSNCAKLIGQSFKDFHKGSGVRKCVQVCSGKKTIRILLEETHAAFLKCEKYEKKL